MFSRKTGPALIGVLLLSGAFLMGQEAWSPNPVVFFPDPGLEAAVREAIAKPTGDILASDLVGLEYLDANDDRNISDLTGIEYCVDLVQLYLDENQISDISLLAGLTHLTDLYMNNNQVSDISPLTGLTNLYFVMFNNNRISDLQPLVLNAGFAAGDTLFVDGNPLSAVSCNTYRWDLVNRGVSVNVGYSCGF